MYKLLASVSALFVLSACAGSPVIAPRDVASSYLPTELAASAGKAPIAVSVRGRPFGLADQAAASAILPLLPTSGPAAGKFAAAAGPTDRPTHHLVFNFAAPIDETAEETCRGGRAGGGAAAAGDRVVIQAALCLGLSPMSWAVGRVDQATSPDSPAFKALIDHLGSLLMPTETPGNRGEPNNRLNS
ncbi:MAG: hypothetical protein ACOVVK_24120 [Elsteraceae bacterium]